MRDIFLKAMAGEVYTRNPNKSGGDVRSLGAKTFLSPH